MDKKESVEKIRKNLETVVDLRRQSHEIWGKQTQVVSEAMREILALINPAIVEKVEGYIGKTLMGIDHCKDFFLITVDRVRFRKGALDLYGRGVAQVSFGIRTRDSVTIEYKELPMIDSKFDIAKDDPKKYVTEYIEKRRKLEMEAAAEKIRERLDKMGQGALDFLDGKERTNHSLDIRSGRETFRSIVRDETGFSWGEICRTAGVECPEDPPIDIEREAD
jgi:hypothetical protein